MERIGETTYRELLNVALKINKLLVKPMENANLKCSFTLEDPIPDKLCEVTHRIRRQCSLDWVDCNCGGLITRQEIVTKIFIFILIDGQGVLGFERSYNC